MSQFATRAKELLSSAKKGDPIPRVNKSVDSESLWPARLEVEADKAASILRSFFCDGFIVPYRTLAVCDQSIIRKCQGLAVFHLLRDGLNAPQISGSGVLVNRLPDGTWSGPSAILIDYKPNLVPTDIDALDVVLVINDRGAMDSLSDCVVSLQRCLTVATGPVSQGRSVQTSASAWSYAKSRGERVEVDLGHLVLREATKENARFYGVEGVSGREILSGQAKTPTGVSDYLSRMLNVMDSRSGNLSGLPKPGKCPGDRRLKAAPGGA